MSTPHFFGYGSLVNRNTHTYPVRGKAHIMGFRRVWRHSTKRRVAFLTVEEAEDVHIAGLVAEVPGADWDALDARERAYDRLALPQDHTPDAKSLDLHLYRAKPTHVGPPSLRHPVLLSYLDTVVDGYLSAFGETGVKEFFATTAGWDAPIRDDRRSPVYPRATEPDKDVLELVDAELRQLSAKVQK